MDNAEHADNTNSPNDKYISSIREDRSGAVRITISDGSVFFVHSDDYSELNVTSGEILTEDCLLVLHNAQAFFQAYRKSLDLLAVRDHSCREIQLKLIRKKYPQASADRVVQRLRELGYLDDERFARNWIDSRRRKAPEGSAKLLAGLIRKGVRSETARAVVHELITPEAEAQAFREAVSRASRPGRSPRSIAAALSRKGFPESMIRRYLEENENSF